MRDILFYVGIGKPMYQGQFWNIEQYSQNLLSYAHEEFEFKHRRRHLDADKIMEQVERETK